MQQHIKKIIYQDQVGFLPGKQAGDFMPSFEMEYGQSKAPADEELEVGVLGSTLQVDVDLPGSSGSWLWRKECGQKPTFLTQGLSEMNLCQYLVTVSHHKL